MDFISRIDNAFVWMKSGGVYKQAELYRRGEVLFAKWGGGYVRLSVSGATSAPKVTWLEVDAGDLAVLDVRDGQLPVYLRERTSPVAVEDKTAHKTKRRKLAA